MNKLILTLAACLFLQKAMAQSQNVVKFNSPIAPSPTAASLGKYGDIPVSTYTGIPSIQIPLYEIKVGANILPIGLSYYAGGLKVSDEASNVGLGWSLNAGGVITRTKKMKDDFSPDGYYKNSIHTNDDGKDKEPDLFYFNFANFSGKFLIDYSSNPSQPYEIKRIGIYNDDDLKIVLNSNQTWTIIDKYGTRYDFNTTETQHEESFLNDDTTPHEVSDYVSSWFLSKVIYTNGEEMIFNYANGAIVENTPIIDLVFGQGNGYITGAIPFSCYQPPVPRNTLTKTTYKVKINTVDLTEIVFPSGKVVFSNVSSRLDLRTSGGPARKLYEVQIYNLLSNGYNLLKTFRFKYDYFSSSGRETYLSKRLRLDRVSEIGATGEQSKNHDFFYNNINLPDKDSKNIDHWGYYCGPRGNIDLFPRDEAGNLNANARSRNPDANYVKSSILSGIRYPTQLYTWFDFEPNDFVNLGTNLSWSSLNNAGNGMLGAGVRIKSIRSKDELNSNLPILTKSFDYVSDNGTQSSGKIMSKINYSNPYDVAFLINFPAGTACSQYNASPIRELGWTFYTSSSIPISGDAQGSIIGYDRIVVKNVGSTETTKSVEEYHNYSSASLETYPRVPQVNNNSNGLLKKRTEYVNIQGVESPLRETELTYVTKSANIVKGYIYLAGWRANSLDLTSYDILNEWIVNSKIIEKIYEPRQNSSNISKTINFSYDNTNRQKIQEDFIDSKEDSYVLKYLYPKDMVALGHIEPYQEMENRHMTGYIVQVEKYKNSILLEKNYNDYQRYWPSNSTLILPSGVRTQYMSRPSENRLSYNAYDKKGNILTVSYQNGIKTSYLWSYNYQNPIAEIKNADYTAIENILGAGAIDNFAALTNPDKAAIDNFIAPLVTGLPNALISSYVYSPLIGLLSSTDTKGQTTYYEYDDYQRLQAIKDQNGHIVKVYKYNYGPTFYYSVKKEQSFTRNNCDYGSSAAPILFTVPAGQFISTISQEDADLQAENYLLANGQDYANTNGVCKISAQYTVTFTTDPYFGGVSYTLTKSFDDEKRALCKVRIRYDPISGGGAITEVIEEIQMENGVLEYHGYRQVNAATTIEVDLVEVIEN